MSLKPLRIFAPCRIEVIGLPSLRTHLTIATLSVLQGEGMAILTLDTQLPSDIQTLLQPSQQLGIVLTLSRTSADGTQALGTALTLTGSLPPTP